MGVEWWTEESEYKIKRDFLLNVWWVLH